jgi:putative endopeptidase
MLRSLKWAPPMLLMLCAAHAADGVEGEIDVASPASTPRVSEFGSWGLDLTARDPAVRAGTDFYTFANGRWLASHSIPPDRTRWGNFVILAVQAEQEVRELIQSLPMDAARGTLQQKIGDYYHGFLDSARINTLGLKPAQPGLDSIAAARTPADIATLMGRPDLALAAPIEFEISVDKKNPDRYVVSISQGGLGLPQREYYLSPDPKFAEIRARYAAHIARMLTLAGDVDATAAAADIVALETQIAQWHWPIEKRRERELTYNLRTRLELVSLAPDFPWQSLLGAAGVGGEKDYVVAELDAVQNLARSFATVPMARWRSYLKYHYLTVMAAVLPQPFDDERFEFYSHILNGQPQQLERWKRAVQATNRALGEAVGQLYVTRYFQPAAKAQVQSLVENLREAYRERIEAAPWMTAETKQNAFKKLTTFRPKIAYPDKWRDFSAFDVQPADAFGNQVRATVFAWQYDLNRLHQPTDRDEWKLTPQTVNASYNPTFNEIVFPAAILQPPFFDPHADAAVNYGAVGAVIGHEMGHGFDDQGAKSDERGVLRTWWQPQDIAAFKQLGDRVAQQYDRYVPAPGMKINGRLTLGENLGDLGGLSVAYRAYHLSLHGVPAPVIDGFTGDQRFFLSWAQVWRNLDRTEALRTQVMSDPHSPSKFRVNGVVRNLDAWYAAFDIQPTDPLYLPPAERVRVW